MIVRNCSLRPKVNLLIDLGPWIVRSGAYSCRVVVEVLDNVGNERNRKGRAVRRGPRLSAIRALRVMDVPVESIE
jgi:hypothetical protein